MGIRRVFRENDITGREVFIAVATFFILLTLGFGFQDSIKEVMDKQVVEVETATRVEDDSRFQHVLDIKLSNFFATGTLTTVDPVTSSFVDGEYIWYKETYQSYNQHSRQVSYKCGKSTCYRTEYYWTWDTYATESNNATLVNFLGKQFDYSHFALPNSDKTRYVDNGFRKRVIVDTLSPTLEGTIHHVDGVPRDSYWYRTVDEVISTKKGATTMSLGFFWVAYSIVGTVIIISFVLADNRWLNKN